MSEFANRKNSQQQKKLHRDQLRTEFQKKRFAELGEEMGDSAAANLVDLIAQRADGMKYSWSTTQRIWCWSSAVDTIRELIANFGLPEPDGFAEVSARVGGMVLRADAQGSAAAGAQA